MRTAKLLGCLAALGTTLVAIAPAEASTKPLEAGDKSPPVQTAAALAGYVVVTSAAQTATPGTATRGTVTCPGTKVPLSGGAFSTSTSLALNINSTSPSGDGKSWFVDMSNATGSNSTFFVYAVCARKPQGYVVKSSVVTPNPAGSQSFAVQSCPSTKKPLGGGGVSGTVNPAANVNTTYPTGNGWGVWMNNASGSDTVFIVHVVCAVAPSGYVVKTAAAAPNPAGAQSLANRGCPSPKLPIGGGVFSSSSSVLVNVNSTYPNGTKWSSYMNNASGAAATMTPYAVCAAT